MTDEESLQSNGGLQRRGEAMDLSTVSCQEIVDYWTARESECGLAVDWAEAHERCWRCGYKSRLQKCHIVPKSPDGKNDRSNLVLLCGRCHREAPNVADPQVHVDMDENYLCSLLRSLLDYSWG
jgi:ribosomal protein L37E